VFLFYDPDDRKDSEGDRTHADNVDMKTAACIDMHEKRSRNMQTCK
jgi:hypothetical protein